MNKLIGAVGLAILALFMLLGFFSSGASLLAPATIFALLLVVGLPAAGAALLARSHFSERGQISGRKELLRQQTIEAEILRLAEGQNGRLTAIEVSRDLTLTPEAATDALNEMARRGHADHEVTNDGLIVYHFHEVRHLGGKDSARGILDA